MMIAATVLGCITMIWLGKKARSEGITITTMNEEFHKKMKDESK